MPAYIILYDLLSPGQDYAKVHTYIKANYKLWARPTESTWIVVTDTGAEAIRDGIYSVMEENDRLLVVKSGIESAWKNPRCSSSWLQKHL